MEKPKKIIIGFFIIAVIAIAILSFVYINKTTGKAIDIPDNESIILYYGITCPHCKVVEEYLEQNNASSKISYEQKEVSQNATNANELVEVGKYCELDSKNIGAVPLLYAEGKCYVGDKEAVGFFENKLKEIA